MKKMTNGASVIASLFLYASLPVSAQSICRNETECKVTSGPIEVRHGDYAFEHDPACGNATDGTLSVILNRFSFGKDQALSTYAGPVIDDAINRFGQGLRNFVASQGGDIAKMLSPITQPSASCAVVPVKLPKGARPTGYALFWREANGAWEQTPYDGESNVKGWAWKRFASEPEAHETSSGLIYHTTFKNWSNDRTRYARMDVYFTRPSNWVPAAANAW